MNDLAQRLAHLSPAKRALLALELGEPTSAPAMEQARWIAVVGVGCRFPGADSAEAFWRLLRGGGDAIVEVPAQRWDVERLYDPDPDAPGKMSTRWGGFLREIESFDARFFGISPREAARMDPQQRLLLEVSWEALESAGQAPDGLMGTPTGVFVGIATNDYSLLQIKHGDVRGIDAYVGTGGSASVASGRLSYLLGLQGPCMSVDTACSSSLVAVHLACQALRAGECRMALAGGVNVMLSPEITINFSKARMMAADGRCKTFDAAADGYVRGEGCGMVLLKPYADAVANGDEVLAVIAGSAVNQDGRSGGLTVPNGPAQETVIRSALASAGIEPARVSYVEAHGTGTALGDPIEMRALGAVFGAGRSTADPLQVGSVKTNFGHLEAAAGVAGLIKVVLALRHGEIPPHLHLQQLNPHIAEMQLPVAVPTRPTPWRSDGAPRAAGVSAFGFSGTNAHVILLEAPARAATAPRPERPLHVVCLAAKTEAALGQTLERLSAHLEAHPDLAVADVGFTANTGRAHFAQRVAIVADSTATLRTRLEEVRHGQRPAASESGAPGRHKVAFLFTGQGAQYPGMGRTLLETQPTFRRLVEHCDALLQPRLRVSVCSLMRAGTEAKPLLLRTSIAQPALFALEYALCGLWRSWGVEPSAVLGHSVGEYAAACAAGVVELEDALALIAERGRLMESSHREGAMIAVFADEALVAQALEPHREEVTIAAVNAPGNVVISGRVEAVNRVAGTLRQAGVALQPLEVAHAFHSPLLDAVLDEFETAAGGISCAPARLGFISNLTGRAFERGQAPDARYWRRHMREPVRFADGVRELSAMGCDVFVEIGPRPVLTGLAQRCVGQDAAVWLPSMDGKRDDWEVLLTSLASAYRSGVRVDWAGFDRDYPRRRCALPTTPWQRERCWIDMTAQVSASAGDVSGETEALHPRLGRRLDVADGSLGEIWQAPAASMWGATPSPAVCLELAAAAATERFGPERWTLEALDLHPADGAASADSPRALQVRLAPTAAGEAGVYVYARGAGDDRQQSWRLIASGRVREALPCSTAVRVQSARSGLRFGLMFFASSEDLGAGDKYGWVIEAARYADREGFESVWVPERHFGKWGGLYPNPSVLHAALARETRRVRLRAGSVVLPLHDALRVVEEWSVVDNLSGGRVDLSFASGWNAADFVLAPQRYADRHEELFAGIETVKRLWRGEALRRRAGDGEEVAVRTYPSPVQREAGVWVTAAGNPRTFERAGEIGANLLTHLLDQGVEELGRKIALYRQARARGGHDPASGQVSVMLHTFVGAEVEQVRERVRAPFCAYLKTLTPLLNNLARSRGRAAPVESLSGRDLDEFVDFLYERFFATRALLGTPESCAGLIEQLEQIGVNEAACLLDFGPGSQDILDNLVHLNRLRRESASRAAARAAPPAAVVASAPQSVDLAGLRARCARRVPGEQLYARLQAQGVHCAGGFCGVRELWLGPEEALGMIEALAAGPAGAPASGGAQAIERLDACLQVFVAAGLGPGAEPAGEAPGISVPSAPERSVPQTPGLYLPRSVGQYRLHAPLGAGRLWSHARVQQRTPEALSGEVRIVDDNGVLLAEVLGVRLQRAQRAPAGQQLAPWLYELTWEPAALEPAALELGAGPASQPGGSWLVLADERGIAAQLAQCLREAGQACVCVPAQQVDLRDAQALSELVRAQGAGLRGVIHLWSIDSVALEQCSPPRLQAEQRLGALSALWLMQALVAQGSAARLWLVTCGAQAVSGERALAVSQAPLWGLGRTCALEHAPIWGALVDLDPQAGAAQAAAQLLQQLQAGDAEDQIGLRAGQRYVARLVHAPLGEAPELRIHPDASYLITGGLWGLGFEVAGWLAAKGARELILVGRSALPERAQWGELEAGSRAGEQVRMLQALEARGVRVRYAQLDIADEAQLRAWWQAQQQDGVARLRGVVHAASVWQDARGQTLVRPLLALDESALWEVFAPKVQGSLVLERVLGAEQLDFFVCFSSGAALVGSLGQGNYAGASAFLDALAWHRRLTARAGLSVNWGAVSQAGFGASEQGARLHRYWEGHGIGRISPEQMLQALERFVPQVRAQVALMRNDWALLARAHPQLTRLPVLRSVTELDSIRNEAPAGPPRMAEALASVQGEARQMLVTECLRTHVAAALRLGARELDSEQPLANFGFDSLMAIELKTRVEIDFGVALPPAHLLDSPTIASLTACTLDLLEPQQTSREPALAGAHAGAWEEGEL